MFLVLMVLRNLRVWVLYGSEFLGFSVFRVLVFRDCKICGF